MYQKTMRISILITCFLFILEPTNALTINEIMYDPIESELYNEWLELYNPLEEEVDVANWTICDDRLLSGYINHSNEELYSNNGTIIPANGYAVITDGESGTEVYNNFNISGFSIALHVDSATICTGLNNNGDLIYLEDNNNNLIDAVSYSDGWGADGNGKSLCKATDEIGIWQECTPTPGSINGNFYDYSNLKINEFLPNPNGPDDAPIPSGEWIELYNTGNHSIDTYGLILNDGYGNGLEISDTNTISGNTIVNPNSYLTIYRNEDGRLTLNNDGDIIKLFYENIMLDEISYSSSIEGLSWSKTNNGYWIQTTPTPGEENLEHSGDSQQYTITISEFLPDPEGNDSASMPKGEWVELYNFGNEDINIEGLKLYDNLGTEEPDIIISNSNTLESTIIKAQDYLVVYTNGISGFLNNDGFEKIKLYDPNDNLIEVISYSDSEEGNSWSKIDNLWKITKPSPNKENYQEDEGRDSTINIEKVYLGSDNKAKFGDNLRVKVNIYKGDTTKYSIQAYIEKDDKKISKTTKFNIEEKYSQTTITIPIQIFPNCNFKDPEGSYNIIIEGLNTNDKEDIKIEGTTQNLCEKEESAKEYSNPFTSPETIINEPKEQIISNPITYESSSEISNRSAIYFFSLTLILLLIQTMRKKWKE